MSPTATPATSSCPRAWPSRPPPVWRPRPPPCAGAATCATPATGPPPKRWLARSCPARSRSRPGPAPRGSCSVRSPHRDLRGRGYADRHRDRPPQAAPRRAHQVARHAPRARQAPRRRRVPDHRGDRRLLSGWAARRPSLMLVAATPRGFGPGGRPQRARGIPRLSTGRPQGCPSTPSQASWSKVSPRWQQHDSRSENLAERRRAVASRRTTSRPRSRCSAR